jgi:hypothetical protein
MSKKLSYWTSTNVKNSVNAGERKASRSLHASFYGSMKHEGGIPKSSGFQISTLGKTSQDLGNFKTQTRW